MQKKRIGLIGFGEMGKRHALEFAEATGGLIATTGVFEPDDVKYREGCEWTGTTPERYASPAELIEKGNLDGIIIASPNHRHHDNLRLLSGQRLPVMIEKPLDADPRKIEAIVRFAQSYEGPILVDHVMRYAPIVRRAHQLIADGLLGDVCTLHFIQRHGGGSLFTTFRRTMAGGGGQLVEKATHDLDVMLFWAGVRPKRVASLGRQFLYKGNKPDDLRCATCDSFMTCDSARKTGNGDSAPVKDVANTDDLCPYAACVDVPDNEVCLIEMEDGRFGTYSQCYFNNTDYSREYEVIGTKGTLRVWFCSPEQKGGGLLKFYPRDQSGEIQAFQYGYGGKIHYRGGPYVARHFYEIMCGRTQPFTTVEQAFVAEMIAFAAQKAQQSGGFVAVEDLLPEDLRPVFRETPMVSAGADRIF